MVEGLSSESTVAASSKPRETAAVDPAQQNDRADERSPEIPDEPAVSGKPRDGLGTILDIRV